MNNIGADLTCGLFSTVLFQKIFKLKKIHIIIIIMEYEDQFLWIFCGPFGKKSPIVITLRRKYLHCIQERKIFDTKSLEDVTCPLSQPRTKVMHPKYYKHAHSSHLGRKKNGLHYEKKITKNIRPTDILQIYTSI